MLEFSVCSPNRIEKQALCAHRWRVTTSIDIEPEVAKIVATAGGRGSTQRFARGRWPRLWGAVSCASAKATEEAGRLHPCSCLVPHPKSGIGRTLAHEPSG